MNDKYIAISCGMSECTANDDADGRVSGLLIEFEKLPNAGEAVAMWRALDQNRQPTHRELVLFEMVARLVRLLSDYGISIGIYLARSFCLVCLFFGVCVCAHCIALCTIFLFFSLSFRCSSLVIVFNFNRIKFHRFILYSFASQEIIVIFHYLFSTKIKKNKK